MAPHSLKSLRLALMAIFLAGAPSSHAVMYKWIDEDGAITYSNQPPAEPAKARELTKIEEPAPVPTPEIVIATPEAAPATVRVQPAPQSGIDWFRGATAPEPEAPRRVIPRQTHTEAVQDPCLTSSDPNCPQRYSKHYSRYGGYSTTPLPQVVSAGATSGAGGAGSVVGGRSTIAPPNWVAPVTSSTSDKKTQAKQAPATIR